MPQRHYSESLGVLDWEVRGGFSEEVASELKHEDEEEVSCLKNGMREQHSETENSRCKGWEGALWPQGRERRQDWLEQSKRGLGRGQGPVGGEEQCRTAEVEFYSESIEQSLQGYKEGRNRLLLTCEAFLVTVWRMG